MPRRKKSFHHGMMHWPRWLRWLIAIPLIVVGVLGLIFPIMPGWLFLIPGIVLLLGKSNRAGRWLLLKMHRVRRWARRKRQKLKAKS